MAKREDESREDKESRDEEGTATEGNSGDEEREANDEGRDTPDVGQEAQAQGYEFSGAESSGEEAPADSGGDEDESSELSKEPKTAATTQWHPTREEQKKSKRLEEESAQADREKKERRKGRLKKLAGIAGALLVVGLIVLFIASRGGEEATSGGSDIKGPAVGANAVQKRYEGVPQDALALGSEQAPVTLTVFADLQCALCKQFSDNTVPQLVDRYVRDGKLRIEFRNWAILGPDSEKGARALAAAAEQGKAWQFLDLWYLNQGQEGSGYVNDDFIRKTAEGAGLDPEAVVQASNEMGEAETVAEANTEATELGIQEAPAFLIEKTGEQPTQLQVQDPANPDLFAQSIDRLLREQE